MGVIVFLESTTFDMDKFNSISVEESKDTLDVVLYLDGSKHLLHRLQGVSHADNITIKSIMLYKKLYDELLCGILRKKDSNSTLSRYVNYKEKEREAKNKIKQLLFDIANNSVYAKLSKDVNKYMGLVDDNTGNYADEFYNCLKIMNQIEEEYISKYEVEIDCLLNSI